MMSNESPENNFDIIEKRKEKFFENLKKPQVWVWILLIIALILGTYIRTLPMLDHGGKPGLWDITTNNWTLGPDLDPWLFTRIAGEIIQQGSIPKIDMMRNVPLGFNNAEETILLPYMIVWTYYAVNFFGSYNIEFAAALFPVIMFFLTMVSFFFFVREVFLGKEKEEKLKANAIAIISTFFMALIPIFLSRTVAGIPEKESAAFFFMFLALFFFLKAWKQEKIRNSIILGSLAGITTTGMGLVSGLFAYIYVIIFIAGFSAFILNHFKEKEIIAYCSWWISAAISVVILPGKVEFMDILTGLTVAPALFLLIILIINLLFWKTRISQNDFFRRINLPKNIISIIFAAVIFLITVSIIHPNIILDKIHAIIQMMFNPVTGRWNTTVAENSQPYFNQWVGYFGPTIKNIPILFWMFFIGSGVLFKKMLNHLKQRDSWILTLLYLFALSGLIFSRYSGSSLFNGENIISKTYYIISVLLFIYFIITYYIRYYKEGNVGFEKINFNYLLLFALFGLTIFTARSAVRLIMTLGPVAPIFASFLIIESVSKFLKAKEESKKMIYGGIMILLIIAGLFCTWNFYHNIKGQANASIPSYYNQQWQKAMQWVRNETPQNAVFGHWWDYGYWVQSIGKRATVLDGGNAISFWNYWMGRLVLTGDNQDDALDFLYNHDTNYFLIDSSDIGKYGAFSSIGSNENYDRFSWINAFVMDEKQTQEKQNETIYAYSGGTSLDEDLIITRDGKDILLPKQKAVLAGILLSMNSDKNSMTSPTAVFIYNNQRYDEKIRYASINGEFYDFKQGLNATIYVFPSIINKNNRISANNLGALIYLSPRLMRGMLAQKYILNDPFNKFPNFKIAHVEQNPIVADLNSQGMKLPEFIHYNGIQGPIKIWEISYTGKEKIQEKYLDSDSSKYLSWEL